MKINSYRKQYFSFPLLIIFLLVIVSLISCSENRVEQPTSKSTATSHPEYAEEAAPAEEVVEECAPAEEYAEEVAPAEEYVVEEVAPAEEYAEEAAPAEGYPEYAEPGYGVMAEEEYAVSMANRWNAFLQSFKDAVYTFNPPSPIKVDKSRTIHLWVDTVIDQQTLAEELRRIVPWDAERIEAGAIQVSREMRAILTGENFKIKANSPEQQRINMAGRSIWSWQITPTWPGTQTLHLRLIAIPPDAMSSSYTIPVPLDRTIEVKVTFWWLIDHFFEKYWKWLLGGLGILLMTLLGSWLKKRFGNEKAAV